jgi:hypothetical protein
MATNQQTSSFGDLQALLSAIFGSPKETITTTGNTGPLEQVTNTASSNAANANAVMAPVIQSAMQQAAVNFAPTRQQGNTAGLYNSNVAKMLQDYAMAQAASQSAGQVVQYGTNQGQIAAGAAGNLANANKVTTQQSGGMLNTIMSSGALPVISGGLGALTLANKAGNIGAVLQNPGNALAASQMGQLFGMQTTGQQLATAAGNTGVAPGAVEFGGYFGGGDMSGFSGMDDAGGVLVDQSMSGSAMNFGNGIDTQAALDGLINSTNTGDAVSTGADVISGGAGVADIAGGAGADIVSNGADFGGYFANMGSGITAADIAADSGDAISGGMSLMDGGFDSIDAAFAGADGAVDVASNMGEGVSMIGDAMDFGGEYVPYISNAYHGAMAMQALSDGDYGSAVLNGIEAIPVIGNIVSAGEAVFNAVSGDGSVVCTQLYNWGEIPVGWHRASTVHFYKRYSQLARRGYYFWALKAVCHMRKNPHTKVTRAIADTMYYRTEYIAAQAGCRGAKRTVKGFAAFWAVEIFTTVAGLYGLAIGKLPNLQEVNYLTSRREGV